MDNHKYKLEEHQCYEHWMVIGRGTYAEMVNLDDSLERATRRIELDK